MKLSKEETKQNSRANSPSFSAKKKKKQREAKCLKQPFEKQGTLTLFAEAHTNRGKLGRIQQVRTHRLVATKLNIKTVLKPETMTLESSKFKITFRAFKA